MLTAMLLSKDIHSYTLDKHFYNDWYSQVYSIAPGSDSEQGYATRECSMTAVSGATSGTVSQAEHPYRLLRNPAVSVTLFLSRHHDVRRCMLRSVQSGPLKSVAIFVPTARCSALMKIGAVGRPQNLVNTVVFQISLGSNQPVRCRSSSGTRLEVTFSISFSGPGRRHPIIDLELGRGLLGVTQVLSSSGQGEMWRRVRVGTYCCM